MARAVLYIGVLLCGVALAQDGAPSGGPADPELREKLRQYRELSPEQRQELQRLYRERLQEATPEERAQLKRLADRRRAAGQGPQARGGLEERRQQFDRVPEDRRRRYHEFVGRLLAELPQEQREALAKLPAEERALAVERLIHSHRRDALNRHMRDFPEALRTRLEGELEGLSGAERVKKARELMRALMSEQLEGMLSRLPPEALASLEGLEGRERHRKSMELVRKHYMGRVQEIRSSGVLSEDEKAAQIQALLEEVPPMARRFMQRGARPRGEHGRGRDRRGRGDRGTRGDGTRGDGSTRGDRGTRRHDEQGDRPQRDGRPRPRPTDDGGR